MAISRESERRVLQSMVIRIEGDEQREFAHYEAADLAALSRETVQAQLLDAGLWTAFRTRPFSKTPVLARFSRYLRYGNRHQPTRCRPQPVILAQRQAFDAGLTVLTRLTSRKVHVCPRPVPVNLAAIRRDR